MRIRGTTYNVDWGHFALVTTAVGGSLAYLFDARATSLNIQNLLLVQPAVLVVLALYLAILPQCFRSCESVSGREDEFSVETPKLESGGAVFAVMAALGVFAFTLDVVGFDVATFVFIAVNMFICSERRPLPLLLFPLGMTMFIIYSLRALVTFPMPTTFL